MKDRTRKILGLLFIVLFVGYYSGSTLFYHTHEIGGVKIVHSHPYKGDAQNHSHSTASYRLIQYFNQLQLSFLALACLPGIFRQLYARLESGYVLSVPRLVHRRSFLRGPPACGILFR